MCVSVRMCVCMRTSVVILILCAQPIDRHSLLEADVLILSCLSSAPNANPDTMLSELCGKMG